MHSWFVLNAFQGGNKTQREGNELESDIQTAILVWWKRNFRII